MNPERDIAIQIRRAREWLRCCRDMREAAAVQAKMRPVNQDDAVSRFRHLDYYEDQCRQALEDLRGWQRLATRFR